MGDEPAPKLETGSRNVAVGIGIGIVIGIALRFCSLAPIPTAIPIPIPGIQGLGPSRKERTESAAGTHTGLFLGGGGEDIGPAERGRVPEVFLAVDLKK